MSDYKIISSDSHLNENDTTWKMVQKKHGDRAPRIIWNPPNGLPGPAVIVDGLAEPRNCAHEYIGFVIGGLGTGDTASGGTPSREGSQVGRASFKADEFRRNFRFEDFPGGALDPLARLKDQDKDGVAAEVLYASDLRHFYFLSVKDEPFFHDIAESYNEWMMDFCSQDPKRLIGLPMLSVLNPKAAAADIRKYAKRGAKGFMMGSSVPVGMSYGSPIFDPVWQAAEECHTPLAMHGSTGRFKQPDYHFEYGRNLIGSQVELQISVGEMIFGGVFDRFPELKIVVTEADVGWVGYMVQRSTTHNPQFGLKLSPADYIRRNCWFTFQNDRVGMINTSYFGADNFMWASDFPHGITTWPDSHKIVDMQMEGLPPENKRKIVRDNVIKLYSLELQ